MGISRNMYLDVRDIDEIMNIYTTAWDKGLKTTYYLHMKPRHSAEQSTTVVNKSEALGKRGFAVLRDKTTPIAIETLAPEIKEEKIISNVITNPKVELKQTDQKLNVHVSEDPQDALLCEGCQ